MKTLRMGDSWRWPDIIRRHLEPKSIVEIGCYRGDGAARLLAEFPNAEVYMVDPWCAAEPDSTYAKTGDGCAKLTQDEQDANFAAALEAVKFAEDRVFICRVTSEEAASLGITGMAKFSVVIIDGDHSYEAVKQDAEMWWELLENGGLLCLHDHGHRRFGVSRAAEEFAAAKGLTLNVEGSCAWLVKND
jgi:predicted O-methyltransferase YrrM